MIDGKGDYELVGIISHMGSNTACGHYVCHIKKEGRWVWRCCSNSYAKYVG